MARPQLGFACRDPALFFGEELTGTYGKTVHFRHPDVIAARGLAEEGTAVLVAAGPGYVGTDSHPVGGDAPVPA
jgi:hypothetical protein